MASQIQFRRGTAAQWTSSNPVLAQGEPGHETDTGFAKIGDGVRAWTSLPYSSRSIATPTGGDDATSLAALSPDVSLGAGTFSLPAGLSTSVPTSVVGRGMSDADYTGGLTKIECSADTVNVLTVNAVGVVLEKVSFRYTGGTPTAGSAVNLPASNGMRLRDVSAKGFWNNFVLGGFYWTASGLLSVDAKNYGISIVNSVPDHGDAVLRDCFVVAGPNNNGDTGIKWVSGGGLKILGCKVSGFTGKTFTTGIDLHAPNTTNTSEITVADTVVDGFTGKGINVAVDSGGGITGLSFDNVFVRGSFNPTGGYYIRGSGSGGGATDIKIDGGGVELGTNGLSCIDIDNAGRVTITGVELGGVPTTVPLIQLGNGVYNAHVDLGTLKSSAAAGGNLWTTGTNQWIMRNLAPDRKPTGGRGNNFVFSWAHPTITSNSVYSNLWKLVLGAAAGCMIEFILFSDNMAGATNSGVVVSRRRLLLNTGGAIVATTLDTDTATSTDIDINFSITTSTLLIQAKINSGSAATSLGAGLYSILRIAGSVQDVYGYS